jgi:hypothetical protein
MFWRFHFWEFQIMAIASLSPEEFASLREVSKGKHQVAIPLEHETRLCTLTLTHQIVGRPTITAAGRARLASGI